MATTNLMEEFPPVTTMAWEEAIRKDLKGSDYEKKLIWQCAEGLAVKPYYRAEDLAGLENLQAAPGRFPYLRGTRSTGDWRIREEMQESDIEEANRAARDAVTAGAEEIAFNGAAINAALDLDKLLANLGEVPIHLLKAGEALVRLLLGRINAPPISTDWDPFTNLALAAEVVGSDTSVCFTVHGDHFEELGATAAQEVGFTLAAGIDYLAEMQSRSIDLSRAAKAVRFSFAIGPSYFFQIAKFRAFRMAWARVVESFGGSREAAKAAIDARTSRWNKTIYEPYVNVLRGTTEAMSAAIGGADSISVAPYDECYKAADEASRRLARNTQILLKQEALLSRVSDPGGGSYYVEVLTDFISRAGWNIMQSIEAGGGYRKALADGTLSRALQASLAAKEKAVRSGRRVLTGTNHNANRAERASGRIDESRVSTVERGAKDYERLRLRTERFLERGGKAPRIMLAEIGDPKISRERSIFSANLFGCAGLDVVTRHFENAGQIAAAPADLIVLCSSDAEYAALAASLVQERKQLGRNNPIVFAGPPACIGPSEAAGIVDFIHVKSDPLEILIRWQQYFGIKD